MQFELASTEERGSDLKYRPFRPGMTRISKSTLTGGRAAIRYRNGFPNIIIIIIIPVLVLIIIIILITENWSIKTQWSNIDLRETLIEVNVFICHILQ
jgi:hypothetical protein